MYLACLAANYVNVQPRFRECVAKTLLPYLNVTKAFWLDGGTVLAGDFSREQSCLLARLGNKLTWQQTTYYSFSRLLHSDSVFAWRNVFDVTINFR